MNSTNEKTINRRDVLAALPVVAAGVTALVATVARASNTPREDPSDLFTRGVQESVAETVLECLRTGDPIVDWRINPATGEKELFTMVLVGDTARPSWPKALPSRKAGAVS